MPSRTQSVEVDTATLESWQRQNSSDDPAELRAAEENLAEFKKARNESRISSGETVLYP